MGALPRPAALIIGLGAWTVATLWSDLGFTAGAGRWILFVSGTAFLLLFATSRTETRDPGPFERGFDFGDRTPMPSFGVLVALVAGGLALRLFTIGRPAAIDGGTTGALWTLAVGDAGLATRIPLAILGGLSPALLYLATRRYAGETVGVLSGAVLAVAPAHVILSQSISFGAPALFCFLAATLTLQQAIIEDHPGWWWLYAILALAAVALGPWSVAMIVGHGAVCIGWGIARTFTGFPAPMLRSFLAMLAIVATAQAFMIAAPRAAASGASVRWLWMPTGLSAGTIPVVVWIVAGLGVLRVASLERLTPLLFLLAPAVAAPFVRWVAFPDQPYGVVPWPVLGALAVALGLGLDAALSGVRFLVASAFPGRLPQHAWRPIAVLVAGALIAAAILPALRTHYNRPATTAAAEPAARR